MKDKPFNKLTPEEVERLALLLEELGEAIQAVGKVLRHGYDSKHPSDLDGPDNRAMLHHDLGDVYAAIDLMISTADLSSDDLEQFASEKVNRMKKYLHYAHPEQP
jgi:hypothetical protein